jgi:hypothetical protein
MGSYGKNHPIPKQTTKTKEALFFFSFLFVTYWLPYGAYMQACRHLNRRHHHHHRHHRRLVCYDLSVR